MKIDILTLFPKMYDGFLNESIIRRAIDNKKVNIDVLNLRDYADNKHKKVDDTPYGGGSGMVLMCQPIFDAVESLRKDNSKVVLMTPQGVLFDQKLAHTLSKDEHLIFICGHYEGFDERIRTLVDMEISIGDYVLTGGELPSMVITDAVVRLLPGVISQESLEKESFNDDLLDYPTYTKPVEYKGMKVPDILLSGHHENIEKWRQTERIIKTMEQRPDLIKKCSGYLLVKDEKNKEVTYIEYDKLDGLDITPRNDAKRDDVINVTKMILVKPSFIEKVIKLKIENKVKALIDKLNDSIEENDDDKMQLLIDDLERYQTYIVSNYLKYITIEYRELVLKKIQLMINELKIRRHLRVNVKDSEIGRKTR
jgi:tRNA (guanine37-N1)-methyltransferase